jgi:Trk K+ transport system NAD-binding subunit
LFVSPLAEVAYGYEVVPIFHQKQQQASAMPSDDIKLEVGDRLVVLATVESLQRLAYGARLSPEYQVYIDRLLEHSNE